MSKESAAPNTTKNLTPFFVIIFVISLPIYFLAALVPQEMAILMGLVLTVAPITAGLIMSYRENGSDGVKWLLKRAFDYKRIRNKRWYLLILFFWPLLFLVVFGLVRSMGETTPDPLFPITAVPVLLVLFFILALFEEIGWMGYAFEAMESRWHALKASLILGFIWAIWHLPLYVLAGQDSLWIAGQIVSLIAIRILIVLLFDNTGKSVFATILFHAIYNVCAALVPSFYTSSGHLLTSALIVITAIAVIILWDADTLSQYRFGKKEQGARS